VVGIDDTIERRWGAKIKARGIYRDPVRSSHGHVWTTAPVQGKNGRSATWSGAVMCSASKDAVRMTAGHDEFRGSGPNHFAAQCVPWPFRVFPIPA
jgi:hypothetical protein